MRKKIILICSECLSRNYTTTIKTETQTKRFEKMKYCPKCNRSTLHTETK
ncbi:MAG: 50S ribosomal protein L33 [Bacilli bacterium]